MSNIFYNSRVFLNTLDSHYTGSMVCHDGIVSNHGRPMERYQFVQITSCSETLKIHKDPNLPDEEFLNKLDLMISELTAFRWHLSEVYTK